MKLAEVPLFNYWSVFLQGTSAGPKQLLFMEAFVGVVSLAVLQQERLNTSLADKMQRSEVISLFA